MLSEHEMREVCETAAALIRGRSKGLCATLAVLPVNGDGKGTQGFDIVIDPAREAPSDEFLRVDNRLSDTDADRLKFRDLFSRGLVPFVKGFGEFRLIWDEVTECLVILSSGPDANSRLSHVGTPFASA